MRLKIESLLWEHSSTVLSEVKIQSQSNSKEARRNPFGREIQANYPAGRWANNWANFLLIFVNDLTVLSCDFVSIKPVVINSNEHSIALPAVSSSSTAR